MTDSLPARALTDLRHHWRQALGFHLLMQGLGIAIFAPLIAAVGRRLVLASGEPVISNFDLAAFALSPGASPSCSRSSPSPSRCCSPNWSATR